MMTTDLSRPLAALAVAFLVGACNHEAIEPEIGTGDDVDSPATLQAKPLVISANAVGGTPSVDTAFTRGPMFATLSVANPHGADVGHLDVTVEYQFSELSDSVDFVAPGVYRLADPELLSVAQRGTVTVRVAPADTGRAVVLLGIPRPLTEMSATRFFLLTGANVTAIRTVAPDSLDAAAPIRTATNERTLTKLKDFSHLGVVYSGLVLPSIVPGEVRLIGGTLESSDSLGRGETVWDFTKPQGGIARLEFDMYNQAPFTVPAGVPYAISYDAPQPIITEEGTVWPQIVIAHGSTQQAIEPGGSLTIVPSLTGSFAEDPPTIPEYVLIVDTESVARIYPIILAGRPVRAWLNVRDSGSSDP